MFITLTAIRTSYLLTWRRVLNSVHTPEYFHTRHLSKEAALEFIRDYFKNLSIDEVKTDYFLQNGEEPISDTNPLNEPYGKFIPGEK